MSDLSRKIKKSISNKGQNKTITYKDINIVYILPIIMVISVIPLIVKMHVYNSGLVSFDWFSNQDLYVDFFLYYKQLLVILTATYMGIMLLYHRFIKKEKLPFNIIFIPLLLYAGLAFLSSLFSDYRTYSFTGIFEQFESVFVVLSYCVLLYYAYTYTKTEHSLTIILKALLISVFILTMICITQLLGQDFYQSSLGWNLISNSTYRNHKENFRFLSRGISLFNPNYVGVYVSMIIPIVFLNAIYTKKLLTKVLYYTGTLGLLICLYAAASTSGVIGMMVCLLMTSILLWKSIIKQWRYILIILIVLIPILFFFNQKTGYINQQIAKITNFQKQPSPKLSDIQTNAENLTIKYNGSKIKISFEYIPENGTCEFLFVDESDNTVSFNTDTSNGSVTLTDERFRGLIFTPVVFEDNVVGFSVTIDGGLWYFTNQFEDQNYYYVNSYGKYTKIITAPSALFTGFESFATGRGYIWSRTIPLLKDKILLGSGADTFVFEFPQSDYVNLYNYGFSGQLMTKPHSLYLQIAVQTGLVSLIAFLVLYVMYFIASIRLYINCVFTNVYTVVGASILIGTTGYMICGIANDSSVTVAPIFWLLLGIGLAINQKVKKDLLCDNSNK